MHGCMTEYVVCNHPRADGRFAVVGVCCVSLCKGAINHIHLGGRTIITAICSKHNDRYK